MKKTLLAAGAFAFMVASPALAQSYDPDLGSGNLDAAPYTSNPDNPYAGQVSPYAAYGYVPSFGAYGYDPYYGGYAPAHRAHRRAR